MDQQIDDFEAQGDSYYDDGSLFTTEGGDDEEINLSPVRETSPNLTLSIREEEHISGPKTDNSSSSSSSLSPSSSSLSPSSSS
eukprot:CAMPEP_0201488910 /NCGR_PEP_ID=MMETSP0151_2-20130828/20248_1 /ASSEMBLY_ACC=CAM_ASM_000257 /TAXON_ID=200890 /ORGANISM="Paramoeba atlantica, Strain 621/1 / CCAP 1560/9" /LENGTH=82 /DNA_ID=CAMNT_0047874327 /DNA_START=56 /DNA_END=301 /DNA_ORIENTATION=-